MTLSLLQMFKNKTVASFGDGPGRYKMEIEKYDTVQAFSAYDGAPFVSEVTEGRVQFLDLSYPHYWLPTYDWLMCIEVAEHVLPQHQAALLGNFRRHAREGIVLSWANPRQGGVGHVNALPQADVEKIMSRRGFTLDTVATAYLRTQASRQILKNNLQVYRLHNPTAR